MADDAPLAAASTPPAGSGAGELRDIVAHSVLAGLCPLIPVPFLDDWVRDGLRRRLVGRLAGRRGLVLGSDALSTLATGYEPTTAEGCVASCLRSSVVLPARFVFKLLFKKILRKLVIPLAIKDCVDTFSTVFHEAYLVRHGMGIDALATRATGASTLEREAVLPLRRATEAVRDTVDPRPVERFAGQAFRSSWRVVESTARAISRRLRRLRRDGTLADPGTLDELWSEEEPLESMVDDLTAEIGGEGGYLRDLERRLEARLDTPSDAASTRDSSSRGDEYGPSP